MLLFVKNIFTEILLAFEDSAEAQRFTLRTYYTIHTKRVSDKKRYIMHVLFKKR